MGKVDSSGTATYLRDGADVTDDVLSDGTIHYTPGTSERVSSISTFDLPDYLGTFNLQTNLSQSTTATRVYDAFGNLESTTGTPQSPFGFVGAQGYQEDPNSGLKLLGHRCYDPTTGRFLTRDRVDSKLKPTERVPLGQNYFLPSVPSEFLPSAQDFLGQSYWLDSFELLSERLFDLV